MTPTDLRRVAVEATEGPWRLFGSPASGQIIALSGPMIGSGFTRDDAAYIAAANPATLIALLDDMEVTRKALGKARGFVASAIAADTEAWGMPDPDYITLLAELDAALNLKDKAHE